MSKAAELAKMGEVLTNGQIGGRRNIIINGAMQVAQRATSATGVGGSNGYFTVDRFGIYQSGTDGRFTMSQASVTDLAGFSNALKLDVTTADTSIGAGELLQLATVFEGQDLQGFKKGYSEAEGYTLSFYVKGTAKTYSVELYDGDNNRHVTKTFSVTTSWNRVVLNFPADTTGKFDNDNALSLYVLFWIHTGTTYSSGSSATTWASVTNANRAVGVESIFSSTDNEFFITGVQLEVGSTTTPFEHRSPAEELRLCQRYYEVVLDASKTTSDFSSYYPWGGILQCSKVDQINYNPRFMVEKRSHASTMTHTSGTNYYRAYNHSDNKYVNNFGYAAQNVNHNMGGLLYMSISSGTEGKAFFLGLQNSSIKMAFDSEL